MASPSRTWTRPFSRWSAVKWGLGLLGVLAGLTLAAYRLRLERPASAPEPPPVVPTPKPVPPRAAVIEVNGDDIDVRFEQRSGDENGTRPGDAADPDTRLPGR